MDEKEFQARVGEYMETLKDVLNRYEEQNPDWWAISIFQVLYYCLKELRKMLKRHKVSWENPFIELGYPVEADWEIEAPIYLQLAPGDLEDESKVEELYKTSLAIIRNQYVLGNLTNNILVITDNKERLEFRLPPGDLQEGLNNLTEQERAQKFGEKLLEKAVYNFNLPPITIDEPQARIEIIYSIGACTLEVDNKIAYYPIAVGLNFKPESLSTELKEAFLNQLIKTVSNMIPKENLGFLKELITRPKPEPEPVAKPTSEAPLIKVAMQLELQKFGHKHRQLGLFDFMNDNINKEITEHKIEVIGLDISQDQNQAIFAIAKLLTDTNYQGNIPGRNKEDSGFSFSGFLPALQFTPAEYLEAFGLKKIKTARGWEEYSGEERRRALQALVDLTKPFLFVYSRGYIKNGKPVQDRMETISPLILITRGWEALPKQEADSLNRGKDTEGTDEKLKVIAIKPAPIFIEGIEKNFILKPANYIQEIKFLAPHASKFAYRFIDWLIAQAELKRRYKMPLIIQENFEEIAYHLRMDAYIKSNQFKRIRQILNKCYRVAKDLGYLLSYETVQGKTKDLERLELNPVKFIRVRKTEKEIERLEGKKKSAS